jgi:hypothetical protein
LRLPAFLADLEDRRDLRLPPAAALEAFLEALEAVERRLRRAPPRTPDIISCELMCIYYGIKNISLNKILINYLKWVAGGKMQEVIVALINQTPWFLIAFLLYRMSSRIDAIITTATCSVLQNTSIMSGVSNLIDGKIKEERGNIDLMMSFQDLITNVVGEVGRMVKKE